MTPHKTLKAAAMQNLDGLSEGQAGALADDLLASLQAQGFIVVAEQLRKALLALTIHEEAAARREGLEPCHEAQEARALLEDGQ